MEWKQIMEMRDPHKALLAIAEKIEADDLGLVEMENRVEQYANLHGITTDEMAFYPNGERVLTAEMFLKPKAPAPLQKPWMKYLTEEQYGQLGPDGRMLADYWMEWLPKMCERMHSEGTLIPMLEQKAEELLDWHVDMLRQGMREYEALEFIKEEVYALPPEDLVDKKNKAEKLRKAALEHKQRMDIDPTYHKEYEEIRVRLDKALPSFGNDTDGQMDTPASAREINKATANKTEWDFIPKNAAWQCATCKKHIPFTLTCKAHPKQIPVEIMAGEKNCKDREKKEELTKAEKADVEALAAECHEELVKGVPPAVISPVCNQCAKRVPGAKCSEYPKGIPNTILLKEQECRKFQQK